MLKSKSIIAIFSLLLFSAITMAQGSIVYLNPSTGSDTNNGSLLSPYKTFEKALSVSIGEAEIYVTGSPISLSDGSVVDGILSGATTLTVRPNDGYSGSLFAVASNASVIMKNITLAGNGLTNQTVLMLSAGSSLSIEGDFFVKLMGNISLTLTTNPIEFTIAPSVSTTYNIQTVYGVFPDNNGRPLIDESNLNDDCLSYFNLISPSTDTYELYHADGYIRLREKIVYSNLLYWDPVNGNDSWGGHRSNRGVKTIEKAISLWKEINTIQSDSILSVQMVSSFSGNLNVDGQGILIERFSGDSYKSAFNEYLFNLSSNTINLSNITINNKNASSVFYSHTGTIHLRDNVILNSSSSSFVFNGHVNYQSILNINEGTVINNYSDVAADIIQSNYSVTLNGGIINCLNSSLINTNRTLNLLKGTINSGAQYSIKSKGDVIIAGSENNLQIDGIISLTSGGIITFTSSPIKTYSIKYDSSFDYGSVLVKTSPLFDLTELMDDKIVMVDVPEDKPYFMFYSNLPSVKDKIIVYSPNAFYVNGNPNIGSPQNDGLTASTPVLSLNDLTTKIKSLTDSCTVYICDQSLVITDTLSWKPNYLITFLPFNFSSNQSLMEVRNKVEFENVRFSYNGNRIYNGLINVSTIEGSLSLKNGCKIENEIYSKSVITVTDGYLELDDFVMDKVFFNAVSSVYPYSITLAGASEAYIKNSVFSSITNGLTVSSSSILRVENSELNSISNHTINISGKTILSSSKINKGSIGLYVNSSGNLEVNKGSEIINCSNASIYMTSGYTLVDSAIISANSRPIQLFSSSYFDFRNGTISSTSVQLSGYLETILLNGSSRICLYEKSEIEGTLYGNNILRAPIILNEMLSENKHFDCIVSDLMCGLILVDGTKDGEPSLLRNFSLLNSEALNANLIQKDDDIWIESNNIYISGNTSGNHIGNNSNDGNTSITPVKTFARAKELLIQQYPKKKQIVVVGTIPISTSETWSLPGYCSGAKLVRSDGLSSVLVNINTATLTLDSIVIDGKHITASSAIDLRNSASKLIINSGAVLKNHSSNNTAAVINATTNNDVLINGGIFENNSSAVGVIVNTNGIFTMLDGQFSGNSGVIFKITPIKPFKILGGDFSDNSCTNLINAATAVDTILLGGNLHIHDNIFSGHLISSNAPIIMRDSVLIENNVQNSTNAYVISIAAPLIIKDKVKIQSEATMIISTSRNLTIRDKVKIESSKRILNINNKDANVTLQDSVQFTGNTLSSSSIMIYNIGNLIIKDNFLISDAQHTIIHNTKNLDVYGNVLMTNSKGGIVNAGTLNFYGNASIINNQSTNIINNSGILNMSDNAKIINNKGTGILNSGTSNLSGGVISGNSHTISTKGGGIHISGGRVFVTDSITIENNSALDGGGIYTTGGGSLFLIGGEISNNISINELLENSMSGSIYQRTGYLYLSDNPVILDTIFLYNYSAKDVRKITINSHLKSNNTINIRSGLTNVGTTLVIPDGGAVTDASQYLDKFAIVNKNPVRGIGKDEFNISIVAQYFIDKNAKDGGDGSTPLVAFNSISQLTSSVLNQPMTRVYICGDGVEVKGEESLPSINQKDVAIVRYTGFPVAAQPYEAYEGPLFTIPKDCSLTIQGGNNEDNRFTIDGMLEGSGVLIENNGIFNLGGYTSLIQNTAGGGINQGGIMNLSGNVLVEDCVLLHDGMYITASSGLGSATQLNHLMATDPSNGRLLVRYSIEVTPIKSFATPNSGEYLRYGLDHSNYQMVNGANSYYTRGFTAANITTYAPTSKDIVMAMMPERNYALTLFDLPAEATQVAIKVGSTPVMGSPLAIDVSKDYFTYTQALPGTTYDLQLMNASNENVGAGYSINTQEYCNFESTSLTAFGNVLPTADLYNTNEISLENLKLSARANVFNENSGIHMGSSKAIEILDGAVIEMDMSAAIPGGSPQKWAFVSLPFDIDVRTGIRASYMDGSQEKEFLCEAECEFRIIVFNAAGRSEQGEGGSAERRIVSKILDVDGKSVSDWNGNYVIPAGTGFRMQVLPSNGTTRYGGEIVDLTKYRFLALNPNSAFAGVDKSSDLSYEATGASSAARHDTAIAGTWQYTWDDGWNLFGLPLAQEYKKQKDDNVPTYLYCYTGVGSYGGYKTIDISEGSTKMQPYTSYYAQTSALVTATYPAKGAAYAVRHEMFNSVERFVFSLNLNGEEADVTTLIFDVDASANYVVNEDAVKLSTTGNCIWNAYDNAKYVFNRLPFQGDTMCFQLQTQLESEGDYKLTQLNDVAEAMTVYVREIGGNWHDLSLSDFVITDNGVTVLEVCFIKASMEEELPTGLETLNTERDLAIYVHDQVITVNRMSEGCKVALFDVQGRLLEHGSAVNSSYISKRMIPGIYLIQVLDNGVVMNGKAVVK